jgi:hypothetical protein
MGLVKMMRPSSGEGNQLFLVATIFLPFVFVDFLPIDDDTFY